MAPPLSDAVKTAFELVRLLPSGEWAGVQKMLFTWGLVVGLDNVGYRTRFCFEQRSEAIHALASWDGTGFPPGFWIVQKPQDIQGPGSNAT